eukprot:13723290-Alexandrium_andersonii.AAC.1
MERGQERSTHDPSEIAPTQAGASGATGRQGQIAPILEIPRQAHEIAQRVTKGRSAVPEGHSEQSPSATKQWRPQRKQREHSAARAARRRA